MTKKKRIITRLLVVLAALTLISCCFLGSTFARYTSSNSGSASVTVANWNVSVTGDGVGETAVSFGNLSAPKAEWASGTTRSLSTADKLVATITNNSAVAAKITVSQGNIALTSTATSANTDYNETEAKSVFTVTLTYSIDDGATKKAFPTTLVIDGTQSAATAGEGITIVPKGTTVQIYAKVTWTTQDSGSDGTEGDRIDTMVGKYITSVSVPVTYTAVQYTEVKA